MQRNHILCTLLALLAAPLHAGASDDGLVLHYTFEDIVNGVVKDESGHGHDGKIVAVDRAEAGGGFALQFDGTHGYVDCGALPGIDVTNSVTLEAWVKPAGVPDTEVEQIIVGKAPECSLFARSGGWVQFPKLPRARFEGAEAPFYAGMWHHLAGTFDDTGVRLYIDGTLQGLQLVPDERLQVAADTPFVIGAKQDPDGELKPRGTTVFHGLIDEVRIFSRALSADEVKERYLGTRDAYGLNLRCFPFPFNDELVVEMDNVPAGASVVVGLLAPGKLEPVVQMESTGPERTGFHDISVSLGNVPAGDYLVRVAVSPQGGAALLEEETRCGWPARPAWDEPTAGHKVLNNFVTEILNLSPPDRDDYLFTNPREGWIFLSSGAETADGDQVDIYLDAVSREQPVIEHRAGEPETLESMRYLPAGEHRLRVQSTGGPNHSSLVVRTMPELLYIRMCDQPGEPPNYRNLQLMFGGHVIPNYPIYTWDYLWPDVLRNCNALSASYGARGRFKEPDRADGWRASGRKIMFEQVVPGIGGGTVTADSAYEYWMDRDPFNDPRCDYIGADEFGSYPRQKFDAWTEALRRLRANPDTADTQFLAFYNHGCYYGEYAVEFARMLARQGDLIGMETYLYEVPNRYARSYLDVNVRGNMDAWANLVPGIEERTIEVLGNFTVPTSGNWASHSRVDFKVFIDRMFKIMANHPSFWRLYGVSEYASRKCDEEFVRWIGRLHRHYGIEGNTDLLSKKYGYLYELNHLRNVDFDNGLDEWAAHEAEPGGIEVEDIEDLQGIFGASSSRNADRAILMTRSSLGSNELSQEVRNLVPGTAYAFSVYTADYDDLLNGRSIIKTNSVSITFANTEPVPEPSFQMSATLWRSYPQYGIERFENPFRHNYHRVVFRAREETAVLRIADGADFGSQDSERLFLGLLELHPYFED